MTPNLDSSQPRLPAWILLVTTALFSLLLYWQSRDALVDGGPLVVEHQILHYTLGELQQLTGDQEAAVASFERTLRNDPQAFGAHVALGKIRENQGQLDAALNHYQQALTIKPDDATAHVSFGNLLLSRGQISDACGHYRAALNTQPDEQAARTNLAWILASSADEDLRDGGQALRLLTRALAASDGTDPRLLLFKAAAQASLDQFDAAKATVTRAIEFARKTGNQALVNTGEVHLQSYRAGRSLRFSTY